LRISLRQTGGDLPEALWRLFITSRLYARWFDTSIIEGLPKFSRDEILERMLIWSQSMAGCKPYDSHSAQDVAGDVYYCWTHALAKVAFQAMPNRRTLFTRFASVALHYGTLLNHQLAHRYKPQRLPSNHTNAATYGNAIG